MNSSMNRKKLLLGVASAALFCASAAMAGEIYKYTDDDGNVVYLDRPTAQPGGERVDIVSRPTDPAQPSRHARRPVPIAPRPLKNVARRELLRHKAKEADAAEKQERADRCQIARNRMETLVTSRQLFREDENGERNYLDEAQIQEARDKVQAQIEETCD